MSNPALHDIVELLRSRRNWRMSGNSFDSSHQPSSSSINSHLWTMKKHLVMIEDAATMIDEERRHLRQQQAYLENSLRPIFKLPREILSNIFESGLPHQSPTLRPSGMAHGRGQLVLDPKTQSTYEQYIASINGTCTRFRDVLIATPRCWTFLSLCGSNRIPLPLILQTRLLRSQACSFDLFLDHRFSAESLPGYPGALEILRRHIVRCRTLSYGVNSHSPDFPTSILDFLTTHTLRHLLLTFHGKHQPVFPRFTNMATLPLASLCLRNEENNQDSRVWLKAEFITKLTALRLDCITMLSLEVSVTLDVATRIFDYFPSVKHLILGLDIYEDEEEMDYSADPIEIQVELPLLLSLKVSGYGNLGHIRIHIIGAEVKQIRYPESWTEDIHLAHPINYRYPALERFSAYLDHGFDSEWLVAFLDGNPQLRELHLPFDEEQDLGRTSTTESLIIVDSLRATRHGTVSPRAHSLHRLFFEIWSGQRASLSKKDQQLYSSIDLLLRECPDLNVNIAWLGGEKLRANGFNLLDTLVESFGSRVTISRDRKNVTGWPDAWLGWTERE